jgi:hypothetical protein
VIPHRTQRAVLRASAAGLAVALPLLAGPASADTPAAWPTPPHVSGLDWLLVLLIIPAGIALLLTLLVMLPSMVRTGSATTESEAWRGEGEWFGGPTKGIETPPAEKAKETGGASADW